MAVSVNKEKAGAGQKQSFPDKDHLGVRRLGGIFARYLAARARGKPYVLNIEVTNACNARCGHCNCWKIQPGDCLDNYGPVVRRFRPIVVWFTGGEPLLRQDICEIVAGARSEMPVSYLGISTNGWLLDKYLAKRLRESGLDQINISIDFLGSNHDRHRGISGLFDHIAGIVPDLREAGLRTVITTSVMQENMYDLPDIAETARRWGIEAGFSCYSSLKTGDNSHKVAGEALRDLKEIVRYLLEFKQQYGVIKSSDYYLRKIPEFFDKGSIGRCDATRSWLYLTPDGHLKICPDKDVYSRFEDYSGPLKIDCGKCWYTCRGEMEIPLTERLRWVLSGLLPKSRRYTA